MRKQFKRHQINKSIAISLMMPTWRTRFIIKFEEGVIKLHGVRPDLTNKLINEKIGALMNGFKGTQYSQSQILEIVSSSLYNKACAGEPMPWEVDK